MLLLATFFKRYYKLSFTFGETRDSQHKMKMPRHDRCDAALIKNAARDAKWHKSVSPRAFGAKATVLFLPEWRKSVPLELRAKFAFGEDKCRISCTLSLFAFGEANASLVLLKTTLKKCCFQQHPRVAEGEKAQLSRHLSVQIRAKRSVRRQRRPFSRPRSETKDLS
jgi:hypothetical protein